MKRYLAIFLIAVISASFYTNTPCEAALTVLALEPASITVPYLSLGTGYLCIEISMKIYDVSKLQEFHIQFTYDKDILEIVDGKIDSIFYSVIGGGTGSAFDKEFTKPYSGSGIMYTYIFRLVGTGTTTISLKNPILIDNLGYAIPCDTQSCTVSVVRMGEYADYSYQILENQHYTLQSDFSSLVSSYQDLEAGYRDLVNEYDVLSSEYSEKNQDLQQLQQSYNELETDHLTLYESKEDLQDDYEELQTKLYVKQNENVTLGNKLDSTRNYLLLSTTVAIFMLIIIIQMRIRKY